MFGRDARHRPSTSNKIMCNKINESKSLVRQFAIPTALDRLLRDDAEAGLLGNPFERVRVAAIVKFGGEGQSHQDAVRAFLAAATDIVTKHVGELDQEPNFSSKLEALKKEVGEDNFKGLLANPHIEAMADAAWQNADDARTASALTEISAIFNGAVSEDDIACFLGL
jgi:hypothetical protein